MGIPVNQRFAPTFPLSRSKMRHLSRHEEPACSASCSFATSDLNISGTAWQRLRFPVQDMHGENIGPLIGRMIALNALQL